MEFFLNSRFLVGFLVGFLLCHLWKMKGSMGGSGG